MEIKYIILILLIFLNLYLLYTINKSENKVAEDFETNDSIIKQKINDMYKTDFDSIRKLANFGKTITSMDVTNKINMPD